MQVKRFADVAKRLSGLTAWLLGWRPEEFWRATPDELVAILDQGRGGSGSGDAPDAETLARLKEMFPDG